MNQLINMLPRNELSELIDEGVRLDKEVQQKETLAHLQRQNELAQPKSGNSSRDTMEVKESKQQDDLDLPIPQAQRDDATPGKRRPSIEMIVTFDEENGSRHTGHSSETSVSRSITPIVQPQPEVEQIEIEEPKDKSKSPDQ